MLRYDVIGVFNTGMKIQEMRSGSAHLNKKAEREPQALSEYYWPGTSGAARGLASTEAEPQAEIRSDLDEAIWSVVSFERREAGGLTYRQAADLLAFLEGRGTNGLCIITDKAAERYNG